MAYRTYRLSLKVLNCSLLLSLFGCMVVGDPPITDRSSAIEGQISQGRAKEKRITRLKRSSEYIVRKGDTLYSIAWQYGIGYRSLASRNSINSPFVIYPGQKLYLKKPGVSQKRPQAQKITKLAERKIVSKPVGKEPGYWTWPVKSRPTSKFSGETKGVDYSLKTDAKLLSAGAGVVVYEGGGIGGYAYLIIIKHSNELLSAYSFDGTLVVKEQQKVSSGEVLAIIKPALKKPEKVHFEVRKNGRPINPSTLIKG